MKTAVARSSQRLCQKCSAGVTVGLRGPDNLQVINVYDSPESFENFGKVLVPILQELDITAVPEVHEVYKTQNAGDPVPRLP